MPPPRSSLWSAPLRDSRVIDPIAALVIAAIAVKESVELLRGEGDECCAPVGFSDPAGEDGCGSNCDCC